MTSRVSFWRLSVTGSQSPSQSVLFTTTVSKVFFFVIHSPSLYFPDLPPVWFKFQTGKSSRHPSVPSNRSRVEEVGTRSGVPVLPLPSFNRNTEGSSDLDTGRDGGGPGVGSAGGPETPSQTSSFSRIIVLFRT